MLPRKLRKEFLTLGAITGWLLVVLAAVYQLNTYSFRPGKPGQAPVRWPAVSSATLNPSGFNLLLFGHPSCPCTRASMAELSRLKSKLGDRLAVRIFYVPEGDDRDALSNAIRRARETLPNAEVL